MTLGTLPQAEPGDRVGPAGGPARRRADRVRRAWLGLAGLLAFAVLLEVLPRTGVVAARSLPPTSRILATLAEEALVLPPWEARLWTAVGNTLLTWLTGLGLAVVAAVVVGVLIGLVPVLRAATASTIEFLRPIPSVAWIPVAAVLFGPTRPATLLLVVYAAFWQMLVQVLHGVVDVDPVAHETARAYRLGYWERLRWLVAPSAMPYAVTGLRLAATVALILTVTGELFLGTPGLGEQINVARLGGAVPLTYALVLVAGMVGVGANLLFRSLERAVLGWHPSIRREVPA